MARELGGKSFVGLLVASSTAAIAALSVSSLLVQGELRGEWEYRKAVIRTLPYGIVWGLIGAGALFMIARRMAPQRSPVRNRRVLALRRSPAQQLIRVLSRQAMGARDMQCRTKIAMT